MTDVPKINKKGTWLILEIQRALFLKKKTLQNLYVKTVNGNDTLW